MIKRFGMLMALFVVAMLTVGCAGPYKVEQSVEVAPNETAYVVPLEGAATKGQAKFASVDYLESRKVATKRIILGQRKKETGRLWFDYEWIPTERVIKVNRTPVTREWTNDPTTGTNAAVEGLEVESKDSIGFWVGATLTASVLEEDTSEFLYFYAGMPLQKVVDNNVRGFILGVLSREFGNRDLEVCKSEKSEIFKVALEEAQAFFKEKGVTIEYLGASMGLNYTDEEIQKGINAKFLAENQKAVNAQLRDAQVIENERLLSIEENKRKMAEEFAKAEKARKIQIGLEIEQTYAEAALKRAESWDGKLPANIMPEGSGFMMNLDTNPGK